MNDNNTDEYWQEDSELLLKYLSEGRKDVIKEFKRPAITKDVLDKYPEYFMSYNENNFPKNWSQSSLLLEFYIKNRRLSLIPYFEPYAITKEILKTYKDDFINILKNKLPEIWNISTMLFEFCLENDMLNAASKFNVFPE